jgi:hypothetical protein
LANLEGTAAGPVTTRPGAALRSAATADVLVLAALSVAARVRQRVAAVEAAQLIVFASADALLVLASLVGPTAEAPAALAQAALGVPGALNPGVPAALTSHTDVPAGAGAAAVPARDATLAQLFADARAGGTEPGAALCSAGTPATNRLAGGLGGGQSPTQRALASPTSIPSTPRREAETRERVRRSKPCASIGGGLSENDGTDDRAGSVY